MKKFKKALVIGGVLIAMTSMSIYGCSSDSSEKGTAETTKTETAEESKTGDKKLAQEITVSAAASLKDALTEISANYQKESGVKVNLNFGSSGALQQQIEQGAPSDYFISAGAKQMTALEDGGLVDKDTVSELLGNKLVMVVPNEYKDQIKTVDDLANVDGKIAIAEVESVPVGQYTKESLTNLGIWDQIQDKIVFAKDVKATLAYVESGEAVAGFVYKSDSIVAQTSSVAQEIDDSTHSPIIYPEGTVTSSTKKDTVANFEEFLRTDESKAIFEKFGFIVK